MASRPNAGAFWSATTPTASTSGCGKRRNAPMSPSFTRAWRKRWVGGSDRFASRRQPHAAKRSPGFVADFARRANHFVFSEMVVQPLLQKYFASPPTQIRCISKPSRPDRGALRTSRNAGRDAVDAAASGEQQRAGRMMLQRTAKSCGSDAPMLASSLREEAQATVSNKPGHRGEREVSRKPLRGECRVISGVTVVTTLVCFLPCTRGCGRIERPAFPALSEFQLGRISRQNSRETCG